MQYQKGFGYFWRLGLTSAAFLCAHARPADESGRDRDVSADVGAFMKYNKIEGFDLEIQFATKFLLKDGKWALDLTRRNMKEKYNESGYSWCDADKKEELIEHGGAARFLIARKKRTHTDDSHRPMAFIHFRFTLQGEAVGVEGGQPAVYIMDIQLEPEVCKLMRGIHLSTASCRCASR